MGEVLWVVKRFDEMDNTELYAILKLRQEVFILEQECLYPDMDDLDQQSYHVLGMRQGEIVAYARVLPAGVIFEECAIGRVITMAPERGKGTGRKLMEIAIGYARADMAEGPIKISAQTYLTKFYESLGFKVISKDYLEDGIPHIDMLLE